MRADPDTRLGTAMEGRVDVQLVDGWRANGELAPFPDPAVARRHRRTADATAAGRVSLNPSELPHPALKRAIAARSDGAEDEIRRTDCLAQCLLSAAGRNGGIAGSLREGGRPALTAT
jgi:hypothetical protein